MQPGLPYSNTVSNYVPGGFIRMALGRTVLMACLLAVLSIDRTAAYTEITAITGTDVILPCNCSGTTVKVIWQVDNTVVNCYKKAAEEPHELHASYKNRSLFPAIEEGQCSLLLRQVSQSDEKIFKCFTIDENDRFNAEDVYLKISERPEEMIDLPQGPTTIGTSLSLLAVMVIILASIIIGILLMRRRRQRMLQENHLDPQSGLPIMDHSPV